MPTAAQILPPAKAAARRFTTPRRSCGNRLVDALPGAERARILGACKQVDLAPGNVLCEPGHRIRHAWFPLRGFISQSPAAGRPLRAEVGLIGNDGMLGAELVLGVDESSQFSQALDGGIALRISAPALRRELRRGRILRRLLHRYVHVLMMQLVQNATCIASHKIEQRLARLLLMMSRDRASSDSLDVTQVSLAAMLGVRRVGVTEAAGALQRGGLIRYSRGRLFVTDRAGLERNACDCYRTACASRQRWLG
jgi:CRP-like cAMP-binding protein